MLDYPFSFLFLGNKRPMIIMIILVTIRMIQSEKEAVRGNQTAGLNDKRKGDKQIDGNKETSWKTDKEERKERKD